MANKSYGILSVQNGVYVTPEKDNLKENRGFVRYASNSEETQTPAFLNLKSQNSTFSVELHYKDYKYFYKGGSVSSNLTVEYSKQFKRVSSGKNIVGDAVGFISQFSGCEEANKLRKRIIALERIHNSISNESFRFLIK